MKKISLVVVAIVAAGFAGCGNDSFLTGSGSGAGDEQPAEGETPIPDATPTPEEVPDPPVEEGGESVCTVTHFTSGDESRFRVEGAEGNDCIKCPAANEVIKLTYTGTGFSQELVFDGAETNGANAADELVLEQSGGVCWSEDYDAGGDLPSASAFTTDGHSSTIEFDQGPDAAAGTGKLSYYKNNVLVWQKDVTEGAPILPYGDDNVQLK